jgi:hypothetical protein
VTMQFRFRPLSPVIALQGFSPVFHPAKIGSWGRRPVA